MMYILKLMIFGHIHKWKILTTEPYSLWQGNKENIVRKGTQYVLQCEKCGNMKDYKT